MNSYYGFIEEILELDYVDFKILLFQCKLVDIRRCVKKDFFTLVNFGRLGHHKHYLMLASQAKQVFNVVDPADSKWFVVIEGKRRILGIDDVHDQEEYTIQ